ncbi:MAG: hypothetical protein WKF36_02060 [Candidatus Nitrosocosmicus sp.]
MQHDPIIACEKQSEGLFLLLENTVAKGPMHGISVDMRWLKVMRMQPKKKSVDELLEIHFNKVIELW